MLNDVRPRYPKRPQWEGKECDIRLKVLVDRRGNVREVIILESTEANTEFADAAVEAAYETVWKPAVANGRPIALWVTYRVEFVLN